MQKFRSQSVKPALGLLAGLKRKEGPSISAAIPTISKKQRTEPQQQPAIVPATRQRFPMHANRLSRLSQASRENPDARRSEFAAKAPELAGLIKENPKPGMDKANPRPKTGGFASKGGDLASKELQFGASISKEELDAFIMHHRKHQQSKASPLRTNNMLRKGYELPKTAQPKQRLSALDEQGDDEHSDDQVLAVANSDDDGEEKANDELIANGNSKITEETQTEMEQAAADASGEALDQHVSLDQDDWNNDAAINNDLLDSKMMQSFKEYCAKQKQHGYPQLTKAEELGVVLMDILRRKKAPMDTYDELMLWHFRATGAISEQETLKDVPSNKYISRARLVKMMRNRYNMHEKFARKHHLILPYIKQRVSLVCHDARGCIESLLTDPRLTDDDFWFFDDDPTAPPPPSIKAFGGLQTGKAYREAVKAYKQGVSNRVPLPVVFYLDGADTGRMKNMPITAFKVSLGIFTTKYRENDHAWRVLGYVAATSKAKAQSKKIVVGKKHTVELAGGGVIHEGEGQETATDLPKGDGTSMDLHAMLDKILESYVKLQKTGFKWDLRYRGKTWEGLEFVPFVCFVKCDTKEADLLCGSYSSKTEKVKQLCRYCYCPNDETDNPQARFPFKTTSAIKPLCDSREFAALKEISMQCTQNAMYKLRFSPISTRGIHGATPYEMLHAVLLGNFMYLRDTLYEQVGPTSQLAEKIDEIASLFGDYFGRQSERNLPKCKFGHHIREGKINAKEYRGVLLLMASVLHSDEGKVHLLGSAKELGWNKKRIEEWAELVELLLSWEAFLGKTEMSVLSVSRLSIKNRYLMWLIKKVATRKKGMGLRVCKFHAITHLAHDIILFGVPLEFDTGSNESGHKITKVAAMLTQKNSDTFDFQTSTRLDEFLLIDLALLEMKGKKLWEYFDKPASSNTSPSTGDSDGSGR